MSSIRKKHSTEKKFKVVIESLKENMTQAEITGKYQVHSTQINTWKKQALEAIKTALSSGKKRSELDKNVLIDDLYRKIGQLTVERDWLKKVNKLLK